VVFLKMLVKVKGNIVLELPNEVYVNNTIARNFVSHILRRDNSSFTYFSWYCLFLICVFVDMHNGKLKLLLVEYLNKNAVLHNTNIIRS
jgi:hypothetical protein